MFVIVDIAPMTQEAFLNRVTELETKLVVKHYLHVSVLTFPLNILSTIKHLPSNYARNRIDSNVKLSPINYYISLSILIELKTFSSAKYVMSKVIV